MRLPRFYISTMVAMVLFIFLFVAYGVIRRHALRQGDGDTDDPIDYGIVSYFLLVFAGIVCAAGLAMRATGPVHLELAFGVFALWLLYGAFSRRECICCNLDLRDALHNATGERAHHLDYVMDWMAERQLCDPTPRFWIDAAHGALVTVIMCCLYAVRHAESDYFFIEAMARARLFYTQVHTEGADEELLLTGTSPHATDAVEARSTQGRRRSARTTTPAQRTKKTDAAAAAAICTDHARGEMFFGTCTPSHRRHAWLRAILLGACCLVWALPTASNNPEHATRVIFNVRVLVFIVVVIMRLIHAVARRRQCIVTFDAFDIIRNAASRADLHAYGIDARILDEVDAATGRTAHYPAWTSDAQDRIESLIEALRNAHRSPALSEESISRWTSLRKRAMVTRALAENWIFQLCIDALIASGVLVAHPGILFVGGLFILLDAYGYAASIARIDAIFRYLYDITEEL